MLRGAEQRLARSLLRRLTEDARRPASDAEEVGVRRAGHSSLGGLSSSGSGHGGERKETAAHVAGTTASGHPAECRHEPTTTCARSIPTYRSPLLVCPWIGARTRQVNGMPIARDPQNAEQRELPSAAPAPGGMRGALHSEKAYCRARASGWKPQNLHSAAMPSYEWEAITHQSHSLTQSVGDFSSQVSQSWRCRWKGGSVK
jgi:hypothetical protein